VTNIGALARTWKDAVARCPKGMANGPCAGVAADGACEVHGFGRCAFLDVAAGQWPYEDVLEHRLGAGAAELRAIATARPLVVTDVLAPALDADALRRVAAELAPVSDAVLLGDNASSRVQFPPAYRVRLLAEQGVRAWAGINCRDRNRVAIEGEIAACVDAGAVGVHCVTGDHPSVGHRPDAAPVFDLDSVGVVQLAARSGALCSVAHAPAAPPVEQRLPRLLTKIRFGADVVFVDGPGDPAVVGPAVAALRATGFGGLVLACVTSAAGVPATARRVEELAALPGVDGVNLSGGAGPGDEVRAAHRLAQVAALTFGGSR
jgi:methylene-tetrahydrofolate reductase-like protein